MLFHHAETIRTVNPERIEVKMPIRSEFVLVNGKQVPVIADDGTPITNEGAPVYQTRMVVYGNIIRLIDPKKEIEDLSFTVSEFLSLPLTSWKVPRILDDNGTGKH